MTITYFIAKFLWRLRFFTFLAVCPLQTKGDQTSEAGQQSHDERIEALLDKQPEADQKVLVRSYLKENNSDPEAHIAAANWFFNFGEEIAHLPGGLPDGYYTPEIRASKTDIDQGRFYIGSGYMHFGKVYDDGARMEGARILEAARTLFPGRLDIALGVQSIYDTIGYTKGQIVALEAFIAATKNVRIKLFLDRSRELPGEPSDYVKYILLEILNDKIQLNNPRDEEVIVEVARVMVRELPQSVEAWNAMSIACDMRRDIKGRYKCLKRALDLAPEDELVLTNWTRVNFRLHLWSDTLAAGDKLLALHPETVYRAEIENILNAIRSAQK
jgi:hypothetical protein